MMLYLPLIAVLATGTIAGPLLAGNKLTFLKRASDPAADQPENIQTCIDAENCEPYTNPYGHTRIYFKRGMEPGSTDFEERHALAKRDDNSSMKTYATMGNSKLVYGCNVHPGAVLTTICKTSGACIPNQPVNGDIQYTAANPGETSDAPQPQTLEILATEQYKPEWWDNFVQAIQAMGGVKLQWDRNKPWKDAGPFRERDTPIQDASTEHYGQSGIQDWRRRRIIIELRGIIDPNLEGFKSAMVSILTMSKMSVEGGDNESLGKVSRCSIPLLQCNQYSLYTSPNHPIQCFPIH